MRILLLAPQPFYVERGTPIAIKALVEVLCQSGHEVDILTFPEGQDIAIERCRLHRIWAIPGTSGVLPGFCLRKLFLDGCMLPACFAMMLRKRYDIIHAVEESAFMAMVVGTLLRTPYIYDMDSSLSQQLGDKFALPGWLMGMLVAMERLAVRRSAGVITCCRALEDQVRQWAPNLPVQTLEDVTLLDGDGDQTGGEDCKFAGPVLMYVGNLESYQGIDLMLESFAIASKEIGDAHLVVIGGQIADIECYRRQAEGLGLSSAVHFLGPRPVGQLFGYLRAATIVISPRTQGRNTPMKVYSYLDSGRALLATRLATHTQVLDDDIAHLVEPTPQAMAAGMVRLLGDAGLCESLADAARQRVVDNFSRDAFARKLRKFYQQFSQPDDANRKTASSTVL
jgi:glycosyltransferase involved in cell wall biosynthesis